MDLGNIETKVILATNLEDIRSALLDLIIEIQNNRRGFDEE